MRTNLTTERLQLRRWQDADRAPFATLCADAEVMRWIGNGSTLSAAQSDAAIERFEAFWEERGFGLYALSTHDDPTCIGFCGLAIPTFLPEVLPAVEIGWRLARHTWGQGYATEAALAVMQGAATLDPPKLVSIYQLGNAGSARIMQKIGLEHWRDTVDPSCNRAVGVYKRP